MSEFISKYNKAWDVWVKDIFIDAIDDKSDDCVFKWPAGYGLRAFFDEQAAKHGIEWFDDEDGEVGIDVYGLVDKITIAELKPYTEKYNGQDRVSE